MERNSDRFNYWEPKGGLVCFPQLKDSQDSIDFCRGLLNTHGLSFLPGESFGMNGYFRLNFGVKSETFNEALRLMEE